MGTIKKSINFIEEADAFSEMDMNALAGGYALAGDCKVQICLHSSCKPSTCLGHVESKSGPVAR